MSAAESSSTPVQHPASSRDSESPAHAATTAPKPVPDGSEETRVPESSSPNPDPSSQIARAIVQLLNVENGAATSSSTSGSAMPAAPSPRQTPGSPPEQPWVVGGPPIVLELPPVQPQTQTQDSWLKSLLSALGVGPNATPARKSKMSLVWNLCWGFSQVVIVSTLVALSNTLWKNPFDAAETEWEACDRPLGVWAVIWIVRVVLASGLAYWDYVRIKKARELQPNAVPQTNRPSTRPSPLPSASPLTNNAVNHNADIEGGPAPADPPPPLVLPYSHLYSRLTLLSSLLTLSWFLIAHILEYTSLNTCRRTSPHLWWLIFGILGIMYIMVLEVLLLGFIILVLAPILFVFWNLFLFCIGRHPAQNPGIIKPDIGKLSKSLVERIPLVMYIPPPPSKSKGEADNSNPPPATNGQQHEYPPVPPAVLTSPTTATSPSPKKPSSRFRFFKRKTLSKDEKDSNSTASGAAIPSASEVQETWEGGFEKSDYPFVVLEGNRAACAICLMDFEEPRRKSENHSSPVAALTLPASSATGEASTSSSPTSDVVEAERELKLTDAGEGAQPLRLLACGHVFHQTCLDPWLTDVSGRCPVCQRAVDPKELKKRKKGPQ